MTLRAQQAAPVARTASTLHAGPTAELADDNLVREEDETIERWAGIAKRLLSVDSVELVLSGGQYSLEGRAHGTGARAVPACLSVPLAGPRGSQHGSLVAISGPLRIWKAEEIDALNEVAQALGAALAMIETRRERHELATKLREAAPVYRAMVEASAEIVWRTDAYGGATEPSPTWCSFTGQRPEAWVGFGWLDAIHPDDRQSLLAFWERAETEPVVRAIEYRLMHHSGGWRWIRERCVPLFAPSGTLNGWLGMSTDIDEQRRTFEALRITEARQRALVEAVSLMTWFAGPDGVLDQGTTDRWCNFTGQTPDDWNARNWLQVVHPEDRDFVAKMWSGLPGPVQAAGYVYRLWHHSEEWRWVFERVVPMDPATAGGPGYVGMTSDITNSKRSEIALQESEARFRALVEASAQIVWTADADGEFPDSLPGWAEFTGRSEANWSKGRWLADVHPEDVARASSDWERTRREGVQATYEYRARHRSGEWRHMVEQVVPLHNADNRVRCWVGMTSDITDRKRTEIAMQESEVRFRALVEASAQIVWACDSNGGFPDDSPSWRAFTGRSLESWRSGGWIDDVHPDDQQGAIDRWQHTLAAAEPAVCEYRLRHVSGEWRHIHESAVPLKTADGFLQGWICMSADVTVQKRAEIEIKESEHVLRCALVAAKMAAWTWDIDREHFAVSMHGQTLLGIGPRAHHSSILLSKLLPTDARALEAAVRNSALAGSAVELTCRLRDDSGRAQWIRFSGRAETPTRARGVLQDVTSSRLAEERRNLLVGEIAHRGQNLLAVVHAMAGITLSDARPLTQSRPIFLERLAALSRSHSMLTQNDWEGVPVDEIVRMELANHMDQVDSEMPTVLLNPSSAQSIALVLHELVTNAAKHGALSVHDGRIEIKGEMQGQGAGRALRFSWYEHGGPPVSAPARLGFGSMLLRRLIQGFDTDGTIEYRPGGLFVQVDMPLSMIAPQVAGLTEAVAQAH